MQKCRSKIFGRIVCMHRLLNTEPTAYLLKSLRYSIKCTYCGWAARIVSAYDRDAVRSFGTPRKSLDKLLSKNSTLKKLCL